MLLTVDVLQKRRDDLSNTLTASNAELEILQERSKLIKKEIANIKGAIIEIDHLIEAYD
jgi:chromosome segregation ATPase